MLAHILSIPGYAYYHFSGAKKLVDKAVAVKGRYTETKAAVSEQSQVARDKIAVVGQQAREAVKQKREDLRARWGDRLKHGNEDKEDGDKSEVYQHQQCLQFQTELFDRRNEDRMPVFAHTLLLRICHLLAFAFVAVSLCSIVPLRECSAIVYSVALVFLHRQSTSRNASYGLYYISVQSWDAYCLHGLHRW